MTGEGAENRQVIVTNPGAIEATAGVARDTIGALGAQPILLLIVVLNAIFIGAAAWFFMRQEEYRHEERGQIIGLLARCDMPDTARKDGQ